MYREHQPKKLSSRPIIENAFHVFALETFKDCRYFVFEHDGEEYERQDTEDDENIRENA